MYPFSALTHNDPPAALHPTDSTDVYATSETFEIKPQNSTVANYTAPPSTETETSSSSSGTQSLKTPTITAASAPSTKSGSGSRPGVAAGAVIGALALAMAFVA